LELRRFETGAIRDQDVTKLDFEGFYSPLVVRRFAEYMHKHRQLPDGSMRDSDNWQKGIPMVAYIKSGWRHFMDWWLFHRGLPPLHNEPGYDLEEALCGLIFNAQGYLHEVLTVKSQTSVTEINGFSPSANPLADRC
jgi:hypothetical protein